MLIRPTLLGLSFLFQLSIHAWGFHAHRLINRMAVFCLPQQMYPLFKEEIDWLEAHAVDPDKRRYAVAEEACRHFIDLEYYCRDSVPCTLPRWRAQAITRFTEDSLQANGEVPWHILRMMSRLENAFAARDRSAILKISADLGHYIGDAHVPLHTTVNYNGQKTGQTGIHGFWEGRIPELFSHQYTYWVGPATYLSQPEESIWNAVWQSHLALDTVLRSEKETKALLSEDEQFAYEIRGTQTIQVRSEKWAKLYADQMQGLVERRLQQAIRMTASIWYTCWVNAGKPDLSFPKHLREKIEDEEAEKAYSSGKSPTGKAHCD